MTTEPARETCPACGGVLAQKQVEKLLRGGVHTAVVRVQAEVCQGCGDRLYTPDTVRQFETIRDKLASQDTADFNPVGQSVEIV